MTASNRIVPFAIAALLLATPIVHAQVYKCPKPGGGSTYQDGPCAGSPKAAPYMEASDPDTVDAVGTTVSDDARLSRMSLRELGDALRKNGDAWAQWSAQAQALKRNLQGDRAHADPASVKHLSDLEIRLAVIEHAGRAIANELHRRCPNGVAKSGKELSCR